MQWQHLINVERQESYPILMFIIMDLLPMREKTADLLNKLSNGNKYSVELQRHKYDFVGGSLVAILQQCMRHPKVITN